MKKNLIKKNSKQDDDIYKKLNSMDYNTININDFVDYDSDDE